MDLLSKIGDSLEDLFSEKKKLDPTLSIPKLAADIHAKPATVYRWFHKICVPTIHSLVLLSNYFDGCSIDYIVGLSEIRTFYKTSDDLRFSARLKEQLKSSKLTCPQIAEELGMNRSILSKWMTIEERLPDTMNVVKLAVIFGCSLEYLIGRTDIQ